VRIATLWRISKTKRVDSINHAGERIKRQGRKVGARGSTIYTGEAGGSGRNQKLRRGQQKQKGRERSKRALTSK